ncbi:hypothetical protein ACFRCG_31225 [Embleya sp. NPDC056575]|uniref:hypothetical protein n=1 Tax=unclassified Embleya TaxID=2699296 RepID=UPI0036926E5C
MFSRLVAKIDDFSLPCRRLRNSSTSSGVGESTRLANSAARMESGSSPPPTAFALNEVPLVPMSPLSAEAARASASFASSSALSNLCRNSSASPRILFVCASMSCGSGWCPCALSGPQVSEPSSATVNSCARASAIASVSRFFAPPMSSAASRRIARIARSSVLPPSNTSSRPRYRAGVALAEGPSHRPVTVNALASTRISCWL